ncbi:type I secretion system permease/ATPase [Hydrogenophaga borbori]|uniref:Cyclolysin secretion/processing ATP-binding protein CyaB n=1 Tax=Hydrogenophaga borbori TaxID=2294117 RepID=A0A372EEK6_9BURK|nr:type I secretion system permease/ATPase [Hydrogenophaga borbori]RFP76181.1 type I secretion system permease/ATPase [Hydrogenophaga borbori]
MSDPTLEAPDASGPARADQAPQPPPRRPAEQDSGIACLVMIARLHGVAADPDQIAHEFAHDGRALDAQDLLLAARKLGLVAKRVRVDPARLAKTPLPAIGIGASRASSAQHGEPGKGATGDTSFFLLARIDEGRALIQSPTVGRPESLSLDALQAQWSGELILFTSRASIAGDMAKFDFTWFIPAVVKYRRLLLEVLGVSFALQLFALITPLFFQVVMDKVLVHRGYTTLDVIAIAFAVVVVFEVTLGGLRSFVFAHTTSRIDVELGARLFRHLLGLPLQYFQARRVGDSVARVRELENIRAFLTGNALTVVLDLLFSIVFLAVMAYYSGWLTLIVLASLPCYVLVTAVCTPILRARLHEKFNRGAENQAFLVETISGIDTVKAMAVEPQWTRRWDQQLAGYVSASFRTATIGTLANSGVTLISKAVTVLTLYFGARFVIEGDLSVGQLIAFNMLAGQVAQPVMRLANLWTDFQQTGISVQRLGDILNARTEVSGQKAALPPLAGRVTFEGVHFRYRPDGPEVLSDLSLDIAPGTVVGVVGRSGSGKSTLTKLVQRLYAPERGRVLVDGIDLLMADASSLRRQVGVVLQENVLFARSVRDNIALADPGAPLEAVVRAARLAGAHEFIAELPEGYDTMVGEHGSTLSGGQRQRIAIARALMTNPRILILDEATSALDYESERIVQQNMQRIAQGRTVIIVAHRLSAVRDAHRIVVMERGRIVESATHAELLARPGSRYGQLWRLQQA